MDYDFRKNPSFYGRIMPQYEMAFLLLWLDRLDVVSLEEAGLDSGLTFWQTCWNMSRPYQGNSIRWSQKPITSL